MIEFALLIVVWPVCAILAAIIAWSKGRSGCGFFVLSILFGPLALLIAIVVSRDRQADIRRDLANGKLIRCVWCREPVHHKATVCPHCQRDEP